MSDLILPVLIMTVPVVGVALIAVISGRKLRGSCGGVGSDGNCERCGKPAVEIPTLQGSNVCD